MKKMMITALIAVFSITAFSNSILEEVKVSYVVKQAFIAEFGQVKEVTWQKASNNMLRADFKLDDEKITAFFNEEGEHLATTVARQLQDLPRKLQHAISEKFEGKQPRELFELMHENDHAYFFEIRDGEKTIVYKAYGSGNISRFNVAKQ